MEYTIRLRRGTSAEWATRNSVLSSGEPGFDTDDGTLKIGDGVTPWIDLPAITGASPELDAVLARLDGHDADLIAVNDALTAESSTRAAGDSALDVRLDALEVAVPAEASTRAAADAALDARLDALSVPDVAGLEVRLGALEVDLPAEEAARAAGDSALDLRLDDLEAAVPAETVSRLAADAVLSGRIDDLEAGAGGSGGAIVTTYTATGAAGSQTSYTWTKPAGCERVEFALAGAGGGGGGGKRGPASTNRLSGAGGGGGGITRRVVNASDLPASVTVLVGKGGAAGTAGLVDNANGGNGGAGGASEVQISGTVNLKAGGGGGGAGGGSGSNAGGAGGVGLDATGMTGSSNGTTAGTPQAVPDRQAVFGGASGTGIPNTNTVSGGCQGRHHPAFTDAADPAGVAANSALPGPSSIAYTFGYASATGGGPAGSTANAGDGGTGANGTGGGGGGASLNGFSSGAGGAGGDGLVVVTAWLEVTP